MNNIGVPGVRGRPIRTWPVEPGYSYHSESNMDLMQPVLSALARRFEEIGLPLRSIENEWGPGQVECTFAPRASARSGRQCRCCSARPPGRSAAGMGFSPPSCAGRRSRATIPAAGICTSRWWTPRTVAICSCRSGGRNVCLAARPRFPRRLAETCRRLHAVRDADRQRLPPISAELACARSRHLVSRSSRRDDPRAGRRPSDPATRMENRDRRACRESLSLSSLSQIVAGLDGIENKHEPGPPDDDPYAADRPHAARQLAGRAWMRSSASRSFRRNSATCSSTTSSSSSATRPGGLRNGARRAACRPRERRTDRVGAERVFRFFLGGCIIASCEQGRS